jgi:hypothetical protein
MHFEAFCFAHIERKSLSADTGDRQPRIICIKQASLERIDGPLFPRVVKAFQIVVQTNATAQVKALTKTLQATDRSLEFELSLVENEW